MSRLRAVEHNRTVLVAATSGGQRRHRPTGEGRRSFRPVHRGDVSGCDVALETRSTWATRLGVLPEYAAVVSCCRGVCSRVEKAFVGRLAPSADARRRALTCIKGTEPPLELLTKIVIRSLFVYRFVIVSLSFRHIGEVRMHIVALCPNRLPRILLWHNTVRPVIPTEANSYWTVTRSERRGRREGGTVLERASPSAAAASPSPWRWQRAL